uniref:Potassium transporter TrkA n=1 Tax=Ignisphaera aggregans TaxID=334771 RepID=A0A7C2ZCH0_9CREN
MIALITFLLVVLFSIIVVRIGTVALKMTGLSRDVAAFQAQSAFSGVGFTTSESEYVVSHPVRRNIIRILMLLGSAGLTSAMATLVLTFVGTTLEEMAYRGMWLALGLAALYFFARSKLVDGGLSWVIEKALEKFAHIKVYDYEQLLGLSRGYTISQFKVRENSWVAGRKLRDLKLDEEGILVLSIYRRVDGQERFVGAPNGDTEVLPGDVLVCYGPEDAIMNLSQRLKGAKGDMEHTEAVRREQIRGFMRKISGGYD